MDRRAPDASAGLLRFADVEMDVMRHRVWRGGREIALTAMEFRLLRHFMEHPTRVFSREALLAAVGSGGKEVDPRAIDLRIVRLRKALRVDERGDLIRTVRGAGYSLDTD